jgi:ornithine carbamoyltransferase
VTRHYLSVADLTSAELTALLDTAEEMAAARTPSTILAGRSIGMLFEKSSTRTRISFEVGIAELGGTPLVLSATELQLGRGETVEDTARVLSRYLHAIVVRTFGHARLETLATAGSIPVINALSDHEHPCQALADLLTIRQRFGALEGITLAYVGDGNNVAHSLMLAGALAGMNVRIGAPAGYQPDADVTKRAQALGGNVSVTTDCGDAVAGADVIYTDVWASMGQEEEAQARRDAFQGFQVDDRLVDLAADRAIVMHCLPAHRGEEISASVLDGPRSVVWDQAENRLHTQKAVLAWLLG